MISSSTGTNEPIGEDLCARSVVVNKSGDLDSLIYADCIVVVDRYICCVVTRDSVSPTAHCRVICCWELCTAVLCVQTPTLSLLAPPCRSRGRCFVCCRDLAVNCVSLSTRDLSVSIAQVLWWRIRSTTKARILQSGFGARFKVSQECGREEFGERRVEDERTKWKIVPQSGLWRSSF